jgi:hypothetical protein
MDRRTDVYFTWDMREVTSGELLTKQSMRIVYYMQNPRTYCSISQRSRRRNTFLFDYFNEGCCLWALVRFGTFRQLHTAAEELLSEPVLREGKQVVVAWTVMKVVKQLPVEMPRQCSSVSSCVMEERHTVYQHFHDFVGNGYRNLFWCFSFVA